LAADEACTNVIEHAYRGRRDGVIRISWQRDDDAFVLRLHDRGKPFDPSKVSKPPLNRRLEERTVGGLGLHFMRSLMDEVRFEFDVNAGNTLIMVKRVARNADDPTSDD
jgi:serine/threonine-protein kinase RsbW